MDRTGETAGDLTSEPDGRPAVAASAAIEGVLRGTRIMTDNGEVPVEALLAGTSLVTAAGERRRVAWIGRRRVEPHRHPHPDWVHPLRIRRGAIGNGLPKRDLHAAPALMLVLNNLAVPVRALINGATIAPAAVDADYFHVELDRPGTLLADGLPVAGCSDRTAFANHGAALLLHPGPPPPPEADAAAVREVRMRLLRRAHALGHAVTRDSGLALRIDGFAVLAALVTGDVHHFLLPPGCTDVRIISRAGVPAELDPAASDRRRLGVRIERIRVLGAHTDRTVAPDDSCLSEGFHPPERDGDRVWRWTDGHARLPAALLAEATGLDLQVGAFQPAWAGTAPPAAPATRRA